MKAIVFDVDGVLADFQGAFLNKFNKWPRGAEPIITDDEWREINKDPSFWSDMKPLKGMEVLARMSPLPEEYYILTARASYLEETTYEWLVSNGVVVRKRNVLHRPRIEKLTELKALAPAYFLEDSILTAGMADKVPYVESFLLIQSYSKPALQFFPAIKTVKSVAHFIEKAQKGEK